jgi:EAL domain-containing protein (putative c-di-GMP-specific phosphodiesterase class I)
MYMTLHEDGQTTSDNAARDCLLLSLPNPRASLRIRTLLAKKGLDVGESELGMEIWCDQPTWEPTLQLIADELSPVERSDTRVAALPAAQTKDSFHQTVFRAPTLETALGRFREAWFDSLIKEDRLAIYFQPLMQYPPGRVHGYECLMRGLNTDGSIIAPNLMFETATRLGRARELDQLCRIAAIKAASRLAGKALNFFINVIPSAIDDPKSCLEDLMDLVADGGLTPQQITFEIIESDRFYDQKHLITVLKYFRRAGFKLALDDVGAGYSSLLNLAYLRPDYIKLDGELVRRAAEGALEAKIVYDLAETARQNGIITIAEGIETPRQLRNVLASGIRITQGYFHARPGPKLMHGEEMDLAVARIVGATCRAPVLR